jgi:putative membrane protein
VSIVFLVVVKQGLSLVYGAVGLVVFAAVLMAGIIAYRRIRERGQAAPEAEVATDSSASG